jgi:hypothetical protein
MLTEGVWVRVLLEEPVANKINKMLGSQIGRQSYIRRMAVLMAIPQDFGELAKNCAHFLHDALPYENSSCETE